MKYIIILILLSFIWACSNTEKKPLKFSQPRTELLGLYIKGSSDYGKTIKLDSGNKFTYESFSYSDIIIEPEPIGLIRIIQGKFKINSNVVYLSPELILQKEVHEQFQITVDSIPFYESDSTSIKKIFNVVKWANNIYLIAEDSSINIGDRADNEFIEFANNYNSGSEPKSGPLYFANRASENTYENIDKEQIPIQWQDYFIDSVIQTTIIAVEEDYLYDSKLNLSISRFELNSGSDSGIKVGIEFYGEEGCCIIKIIETTRITSKGIIKLCTYHQDVCKIGDRLSTWNEREFGKYVP